MMTNNLRRLGILVVLAVVLFLGAVLVAFYHTAVGVTRDVETGGRPLYAPDLAVVPEIVAEDAVELAMELFGDYRANSQDFANQLMAMYAEARDQDFVVIFNPGGWGWKFLDTSPGWCTIFDGIEYELASMGYTSLMLDYQRTESNLHGMVDEFVELLVVYPSKAENLAYRVEFLTSHIPDLKVIITGESNGTVIADTAMNILQDNPQVYSVQTGSPFWYRSATLDRTLLLNGNGVTPDSFSRGDVSTILWTSLKALVGQYPSEEEVPGKILAVLRAPGHDYRWQYPVVYSEIRGFLTHNFDFKP
ncbi:MAG: hypothetical protein CL874_04895 [Dehalococcoidales bacterium]|jgi:hypothetical protein|nr:hypothetical protein [Dehalococcoidales bacterium]MDP6449115.1 hypothetical protein [Dehalococcoidales bacterium]MDP6576925.1 hypothetical protein [Dehalococcoidales bacterium]